MTIISSFLSLKASLAVLKKMCKVLMMMKAAKLGWAEGGAGKEQSWSRSRARKSKSRAGQEQARSRNRAGVRQE